MFITYTEIHGENGLERWFYGAYNTRERANEVALELGSEYPVYRCVCEAAEAKELGIRNMPK